jgi:Hint domain
MSDTTVYEYKATPTGTSGFDFTVSPTHEQSVGLAVVSDLSQGDQFVFDGKVFTYQGGADQGMGGTEVGFFATSKNGTVHFFSTTQLPGTNPETLVLNNAQSYAICFMAGTHVATPEGSVCVEDLAAGDLVLTAEGLVAPIKWVGRQTMSTTFGNLNRILPIRIKAGALDQDLPTRDLLVSACHAILIDGVLVQAGALVNGSTIIRETDVPTSFVYYHVELEDHSLILGEGVPAETFIDNVDRLAFDNWDEHVQLYPEGRSIKELPYPRAASSRQVPAATIRKLAARAGLAAGQARDAA